LKRIWFILKGPNLLSPIHVRVVLTTILCICVLLLNIVCSCERACAIVFKCLSICLKKNKNYRLVSSLLYMSACYYLNVVNINDLDVCDILYCFIHEFCLHRWFKCCLHHSFICCLHHSSLVMLFKICCLDQCLICWSHYC
jgi:hypothetical protein